MVSVAPASGGYQINLDAPVGSYQPGARNFVFVVKSNSRARQVTLDGKPLGVAKTDEKGNGWQQEAGATNVRIVDDGRAHTLSIR